MNRLFVFLAMLLGSGSIVGAATGPTVYCKNADDTIALVFGDHQGGFGLQNCRMTIEEVRYCFNCSWRPHLEVRVSTRECVAPKYRELTWRVPIWSGYRFRRAGEVTAENFKSDRCWLDAFPSDFNRFLETILPGKSSFELGYEDGAPDLSRGWIIHSTPARRPPEGM